MSYGWLGAFRKGAWLSLRSFVLNERKDVGRRILTINSEIRKIGNITVTYSSTTDERTGQKRVTEERRAFSVSKNSSLEKLVQAYIVMGGNPLDISQFFMPDRTVVVDGERYEEYPYGGLIFPMSSEVGEPEGSYGMSTAGFAPIRKYKPLRVGGRVDIGSDSETFVNMVADIRKPVQQEIRYKIHDMESRILKLCDLKEQLMNERDEILVQAFGGISPSITDFELSRFAIALRVPYIINKIDAIFFSQDENGFIDLNTTNLEELPKYINLWDDILPDENNTAI